MPHQSLEEFVAKNKYLSECQKRSFFAYRKKRFTYYEDSDYQIHKLFHYCKKTHDYTKLADLIEVLKKFTDMTTIYKVFNMLSDKRISDLKIKRYFRPTIFQKDPDECALWDYIFENLALTVKRELTTAERDAAYLDIGCGSGKKTNIFGKALGITNIQGADVKSWDNFTQNTFRHRFPFKYIKDGKLDWEDNTFDILTAFQVLHHVEDLDGMLREIKRVLKPKCLLVMIEHNVVKDSEHLLVDIMHRMYSDKKTYAKYYNWIEWDYVMIPHNFIYVKSNYVSGNITKDNRMDSSLWMIYVNEK